MGDIVILACSECKRRNYTTTKSKTKKGPQSAKTAQKAQKSAKLQLMKYCPFDRKHTLHKETK